MGQNHGDSIYSIKNKQLLEQLSYVQSQHSQNYGHLLIYRLNQKPYDYYVRFRQIYHHTPTSEAHIQQTQQLYESLQGHRNIARVDVTHIDKTLDLCSNAILFDSYARYHNYTLQNAISCKRMKNKMFKDSDLLYIMNSLTDVRIKLGQHLKKKYIGVFRAEKVYLSTEGYLKIYPFRLNSQPIVSQLSLEEIPNGSSLTLSSSPKSSEQFQCYRTNVTDLKDLAFLMAQLCLLENKQTQEILTKEQTRFSLQKGLTGKISPLLRHLILRLLEGEQMSWERLQQESESIKALENIRTTYSIRLDEDILMPQSESIEKKEKAILNGTERKRMLSSLQLNLVPSRIQLYSSRRAKEQ